MRKILYTTSHPAPYIEPLLALLRERYELTVVYRHRGHEYKKWRGFEPSEALYYEDLSLTAFLRLVRRQDLSIIGGWLDGWSRVALLLSPFFRAKVAMFSDCPESYRLTRLKVLLKKLFLLQGIDYLFGACQAACDFYGSVYGMPDIKLKLFPYYTRVCTNDDLEQRTAVKKNVERKHSAQIFVANAFLPRKGYDTLLAALRILAEKGKLSRYSLTVAGDGDLFPEMRQEISALMPSARFLGWIEAQEYEKYMDECDIFIHASSFEPFGIPPLDAMHRGIMLISSDGVMSVKGLIDNGRNGWLFSSGNAVELSAILSELDLESVAAIGAAGKLTVDAAYNEQIYFDTIESCFEE